jgi:hypothetical protein
MPPCAALTLKLQAMNVTIEAVGKVNLIPKNTPAQPEATHPHGEKSPQPTGRYP